MFFKKILLAVTPSPESDYAAREAISLALQNHAKLYVFHACGMEYGWGQVRHLVPCGEVEKIQAHLKEYYQEMTSTLPEVVFEVTPGLPHTEILRFARRNKIDLIVMGPHASKEVECRSSIWGTAGSCLEKVSQKARCPVLIVTRPVRETTEDTHQILVATDFSQPGNHALNYGRRMAREYKAGLHVFHAVSVHGGYRGVRQDQEAIEAGCVDAVARINHECAGQLEGIPEFSAEAWEGIPYQEILKSARQNNADLIIMAHHSKDTKDEAFMGSTMVRVALRAHCPVMSVNYHAIAGKIREDETD
ncbi:MAG: universal stress protein [Desulfoplanes sp.]|nr:universal stress protein [Desulfoplanes sp.]